MNAPKQAIRTAIIRARADLFHLETTLAQAREAGMELTEDEREALKFLDLTLHGSYQALHNIEGRLQGR